MVSVYPRRSGNVVTPWIDGVPFYDRLLAAVRAARSPARPLSSPRSSKPCAAASTS